MSCDYSLKTKAYSNTDILKINQNNNENNEGFASLKKGQKITGTVVSVDEQVTLDFSGLKVTTPKSVLSSVKPGDVKNFEVVKANDNEIELKLLDETSSGAVKTIKAFRAIDNDWDKIIAKKEQTAKKADQEAEYQDTKNKLDKIASTLTEHDCSLLEKEGFQIEKFTVDGLVQTLNRVKTEDSKTENNAGEKTNSDYYDKEALGKWLKQENLPVTEDNLNKLSSALELSGCVANMDDKTMQYLIATDSEPSVQNIYKAYYSGNTMTTDKLTDTDWNQLKNQVADVIQTAGYVVDDQNLADARWLIENNIPLTAETFTYKKDLDSIKSEDKEDVLNTMLNGMKEGINPNDVSLLAGATSDYEQIIADIHSISDEAVAQAVSQDSELTIGGLVTIQNTLASVEKSQAAGTKNYSYEELKARRQLEEIRLKMTVEAAANLEKNGISIDTEELSKVVEELRNQEDEYYRNLLKEADAEASDLSVQTLKETTQSIEQLRYMPCSVLGSTLSQRNSQTITGLLMQGSTLAADYAKAGNAYETLATVPNTEYGDSLQKAFANADSWLTQMGLDNTEENRRAIRILGYNQMDITEESVKQVKAYDKQVTSLIDNLHPAVTVRMIKQGINPMEMPIWELNQTIDNIKEEQGITSEDKFSTYLYNLEKQQGITSEERKAYIGIYRLLYNVDKSDGAAIGAVVKADRDVTLGNLLTAIQTSKKGNIDSLVNDEFGSLQEVNYKGESIAEQLRTFENGGEQQNFGQTSQNSGNSSDDATKEQTEYLDRILKQIKEEVTPQKLMEAGNSINYESSLQNQSQAVITLASSDKSLWEKLKGVPVEELLEQLRNMQDPQAEDSEIATQKVQEIRELCKNAEQSIRFLNDYRMPSTSMNIMMANSILSNGESSLKKLFKQKSEDQTENLDNSLKETNDLSDTLNDKNSMQDAYEQLETKAKDALSRACSEEVIDSRRLAELKSVSQQMTFLRTLAGKEFYQIPIETTKGITNINLTILRGTDTSGKVSVNVGSQTLGNIKAEFSLKDQVLKGFFSSDNRDGLNQLRQNTGEIENAAQVSNITIKQMDFGMLRRDNENYIYQNPNQETGNNEVSNNTERILYRIAKAVVQTVRSTENGNTESDVAV